MHRLNAFESNVSSLSEEMMEKLEGLSGVEVNVDDPQEADEFDGDVYYYPMLTE